MEYACEMCGARATHFFGYHPLCSHPQCKEDMIELINGMLREEGVEEDVTIEGNVEEGEI